MNNVSISVLQIAISAVVSIVVVALGHVFTLSRDRRNRRQEQRIAYLVEAYRSFAQANHHPRLYEIAESLEQAVADVQLFGTPRQVQLVQQFAVELAAKQVANLDEILFELRDSLRSELGAEQLTGRIQWIKVSRRKA